MTAEEIDIIVNASVEKAVKEFEKLLPAIKKQISNIQKEFDKVNIKDIKANIDIKEVAKKVKEAKKQIKDAFDPNDTSGMKIDGKLFEIKDIKGYSQEVRKLKAELGTLSRFRTTMPQVEAPKRARTTIQISSQDNSTQGNKYGMWTNMLRQYYAYLDTIKVKIAQVRKEAEKTKPSISSMKDNLSKMPSIAVKISNNIKNMGTGLKTGLGTVLKYAGALFGLRTIYNALQSSASAWLGSQNAQAQQLSANIEYMKYAMGSAFAPVIEYVTNLVYQLLKAVQSLVYAFSGVNIFAKATASSMGKAAGSAKETNKALAGVHNEINNVSENNNSSGAGAVTPSMDLSQMENTPNAITDAIKNGNWYAVGAVIGQKLNEVMEFIPWSKIQESARNIAKGTAELLNGFIAKTNWNEVGNTFAQGVNTVIYAGQSFLNTFDFTNLGRAYGTTVSSYIKNIDWGALGNTLSQGIAGVFDTIAGVFQSFDWSVIFQGLWDFIAEFDWNGVSDAIFEALGSACASLVNFGMVIGEYIKEAFNGIGKYFNDKIEECGGNVVAGILKGIGDAVIGIGQWIYEHIFEPFINGFKNAFGIHSPSTIMAEMGGYIIKGLLNGIISLVGKVTEIWQNMKDTVVNKFSEIKTSITNVWNNVKNTTSNVWNTIKDKVKQGAQGAWNGITSIFGNVSGWFKDKFTQAWQAVKNVFSTGGAIFDGIKDGILSGLKSIVNAIINGINKVISIPFNGLNSALRSIRNIDIMGLKPFSWINTISIPQIPRLAKGGVVDHETIAMIGEYSGAKSNPEIVTPQNIMYDTMRRALEDTAFSSNDGQAINLIVNVGNKKLGQLLLDELREIKRQTGKDIEAIVGG